MKYFVKIIIALVLAVGVVTGVYYYTNNRNLPFELKKNFSTTVTKEAATEKYAQKKLLASLDKYDFKLYKSKGSVILEHGKNEFVYNNWSKVIDSETPKMYYTDIDGDKEKELIIRAVSGKDDSTGEYVYEIYVLNPKNGKKEDYDVLLISQDTWRVVLDNDVAERLVQSKSCKKIVQLAMDEKNVSFSYDKSGLIKNAAYSGYGKALRDDDGRYMTLAGWTMSKGLFFVDNGKDIKVEVDCAANYNETHETQILGKIYFSLSVDENNKLSVVPHTMYFKADDKYKISDPTVVSKKNWNFTRNNSFAPNGSGEINWVTYHIDMDSTMITDTADLSGEESDIKDVKSMEISQSGIMLRAANNYTFSQTPIKSGDFSAVINKGKKDEYEISYTAKLGKDKKSVFISFDKKYPQKEIKTIDINYGAR